jgi:hypothetical protein
MTSMWHAFPPALRHATLASSLFAAIAVVACAPAHPGRLADEVVIEESAPVPAPQTRPIESQTPQRGDQPRERKRSEDGPPRDELLPGGRRLPA